MNAGARLPLTVIGGFLGAGKTTLLNRLLQGAGGRRLAVLVNDFGAVNIDAALVASRAGDAIALTNGCVCCSIGDDLTAALIRVLDASPPFDAVVIEASGVSDPGRIAQVGLAEPALSLDSVVVLVDAAAVLAQSRDAVLADSLQRQLRSADVVVVNKTDLVDGAQLQAVRRWVAAATGGVTVFETVQAAVPPVLLGGSPAGRHACSPACAHEFHEDGAHDHVHDALFETWSARPGPALSADRLRAALRELPAGVLRLKGIVRTIEHGWSEVQFSGRHGTVRRAGGQPTDGPALVAIGLRGRLPIAALDDLARRG